MKTLGIITTTYNRAYCISQVYNSLKRQSNKDFMWLVVDDGSTDNTKDLIEEFINENEIDIQYIYQENMGMHGARNTAYENIKTEINTIVDSDDYLIDDAVDKIIYFWSQNKDKDIAGIIALNCNKWGEVIGTELPKNIEKCTTTDLYGKYRAKGDKKLIYRSDISKKYPYPIFEGEKFFPPSYKFMLIDLDYKMLLMNTKVCVVDYSEDSMTFDKINQYRTCAKGFSYYRNEMIRILNNPRDIIKESIHFIAESLLSGNYKFIKESYKRGYTILCLPIGIPLYFFLKYTKRKKIRI